MGCDTLGAISNLPGVGRWGGSIVVEQGKSEGWHLLLRPDYTARLLLVQGWVTRRPQLPPTWYRVCVKVTRRETANVGENENRESGEGNQERTRSESGCLENETIISGVLQK